MIALTIFFAALAFFLIHWLLSCFAAQAFVNAINSLLLALALLGALLVLYGAELTVTLRAHP